METTEGKDCAILSEQMSTQQRLFASGIPSMAQLARQKKEGKIEQEKNKNYEDNYVVAVPEQARNTDLPDLLRQAIAMKSNAIESTPTLDPDHSKDQTANSNISTRDHMSPGMMSTLTTALVKDQMPAANFNSQTIIHDKTGSHVVQPEEIKEGNSNSMQDSRKKKKKKNKKKQPPRIRMNVLHPDSMDSSTTMDMDDFDALLKAHEQPADASQDRTQNHDNEDTKIEDVAAKILGRRPKPKNDRQKQKRKYTSIEGGNIESNKDTPRKKQPVEKVPFVPRVACKYWEGGYCANGNKCTFLHAGEQKVSSKRDPINTLCRHFITGSCRKGDLCPFSHNTKLEACRHFHVKGICLTGDDCPFAHEDATPEALSAMKNKNTPCRFYHLKGYCTSGDDCLYSHESQSDNRLSQLKESETCKYFLNGNCLAGDECLFSHDVNSTQNAPPEPEYTKATSVPQASLANFQLKLE